MWAKCRTFISILAILLALVGLTLALTGPQPGYAAGPIYVDVDATGVNDGTSWGDAYTDLQTALANAVSGDEIWVAEGTYYPTTGTDRYDSFSLKDGVAIYGGFAATETLRTERDWTAHVTVLSGNLGDPDNADDNSEHVVSGSGTTSSAVLDGFTISDGKAYNPNNTGGGIYIISGSPTLANLVIRDNIAGYDGGGLYNNGGSPSLTNVAFDNNEAFLDDGGGMYTANGNPTLETVTFTANNANGNGGGLYTTNGNLTLTHATFSENNAEGTGGGMHLGANSNPDVNDLTFMNNTARSGGGLSVLSSGILTNLTFTDNVAEGGGSTAGSGGGAYIFANDVTLANATFQGNIARDGPSGSGQGAGGGIAVHTDSTLVDVILRGNTATKGGGAYNSYHSQWINVVFSNNMSDIAGGGLYNYGGSPILVNTTFSGNSATNAGGGIYNSKQPGSIINPLQLSNSIVWGNTAPTGSQIHTVAVDEGEWYEMPMPAIRHSDIEGSGGSGAGWDTALGTDGGGNIDADPLFRNALGGNLHLLSYSPAVDVGNNALLPADSADLDGDGNTTEPIPHDIDGENRVLYDTVDMGADEALIRIWYVDDDGDPGNGCTSWADACPDLRDVLGQALNGDEVWVAAGTYRPGSSGSPRSRTFELKDGVGVYGGFAGTETDREQRDPAANLSLLSGDLDDSGSLNDSDAYHVVDGSGVGGYTVLDGFTISGGNANGTSDYDRDHGGGLYILDGSPVLTNLIFSGNYGAAGGGLYAAGSGTPTITDVLFTGNDAHWGGGIYNATGSLPTLANLTFRGNSATHGGGLYVDKSSPTLNNAAFWDNSASSAGGGIFVNEGSPTLINVTVSGNDATNYGGGLYNQRSTPTLVNSIVWSNSAPTAPTIYNLESAPTISYSDIQDSGGSGTGWDTGLGTDGGGNLDTDPRFVDATNNDMRLTRHSPAIDAGNSLSVTVSTDLAGNPRRIDAPSTPDTGIGGVPVVDMGAYEAAGPIPDLRKSVSPTGLVPYYSTITYTLSLENVGMLSETAVLVTDTLPSGVTFADWVVRPAGAMRSGNAITWTETISAGDRITLTFTADQTGDAGEVITNTAWFSSTARRGSDDAAFTVAANRPPTADAGADQPVSQDELVQLDGAGSSDPDGHSLTYQWTQTGGSPQMTLSGNDVVSPTFTATDTGVFTFTLVVSDTFGLSDTDEAVITVTNQAPTADAGADQPVSQGELVQLDGAGSSDPDGHSLTYQWTQTGGSPQMTLSGNDVVSPTFTATDTGVFTFTLVVSDTFGLSDTDEAVITVTNQAPSANAGPDQTMKTNATVLLDGSNSVDPDGHTPLTYRWTQTGGPAVSFSPNLSVTTFTAPTSTSVLTFSLTVTDTGALSDTDEVVITVEVYHVHLPLVWRSN